MPCSFSLVSLSDLTRTRLRAFALVTLGISLFFWGWAVLNTIQMDTGVDLGIVSFFTVVVSSSYLLVRTTDGKKTQPMSNLGKVLVTCTHVLVALNYALGSVFAFHWMDPIRVGFGIYCIVFMFLWFGAAYVGSKLMEEANAAWMLSLETMSLP
jgi:hypothetical protein